MSYGAPAYGRPDPMVLSTLTPDLMNVVNMASSNASSSTWGSNNRAVFVPVTLGQARTYVKAAWLNGTAVAGNVDVGIGTISGTTWTRIVASTAEAQSGTGVAQVAGTFTTTTLQPGLYYLAMSCSSTSATVWRMGAGSAFMWRTAGCYVMASAHPLPSSGTVATYGTAPVFVPIFGFSEVTGI